MKTWEVEVELRVRKVLTFSGPIDKESAARIVSMVLLGQLDPAHFIKWKEGPFGYRPVPVEQWIDDNPVITRIHEVFADE